MQQSSVIFANLLVGYLLFITLRGELPIYIQLLRGGGQQPAAGGGGGGNAITNGAASFLNNDWLNSFPTGSGDMSQYIPSLIQQESGGNPNVVSSTGAFGLTQILPSTAANPGFGVAPLASANPQDEINFTTSYLNAMESRYNDPAMALAAYNAGPGVVDNARSFGNLPSSVQQYVNNIMGR